MSNRNALAASAVLAVAFLAHAQPAATTPATAAATSSAPASLTLYDFEGDAIPKDIEPAGGATLSLAKNAKAGKGLQIVLPEKPGYSGFRIDPAVKDWSRYELLVLDTFNPSREAVPAYLEAADNKSGIDKDHGFGFYNVRFGDSVSVPPGLATIAFRFNPAWTWNETRMANPAHLRRFAISFPGAPGDTTIVVDSIRLETSAAYAEKPAVWFDFEKPEQLVWKDVVDDGASATSPPVLGSRDSPVKVSTGTEGVTSGKQSLQLTFSPGRFPTVTTDALPEADLVPYRTFMVDVTVKRPCVLVFRIVFEHKDDVKRAAFPRWEKAALCEPGLNTVVEEISVDPRQGKAVAFEIGLYDAQKDEVVFVDSVRLLRTAPGAVTPFNGRNVVRAGQVRKLFPLMQSRFTVLGLEKQFASLVELADQLKDKWVKPDEEKPLTMHGIERAATAKLEAIKKAHPKAVLVTFRRGQKGFDAAKPDAPFDGWSDTYLGGHDPTSVYLGQVNARGADDKYEVFLRRRCPLIRVDVSSIPKGANILWSQLALARADNRKPTTKPDDWSPYKFAFFVAEACNRPWVEGEENVFQYARGKYWQEISGMQWNGPDPDFLPLILAYGQSNVPAGAWDFTEAVKYWRKPGNANHGFALYSIFPNAMDYGTAWSAEAKKVEDRPELFVIYEPGEK